MAHYSPADKISDIRALVTFVEDDILTRPQFYDAVRIVLDIVQRSEQSLTLGRLILAVSAGELPVSALTATLDEPTG